MVYGPHQPLYAPTEVQPQLAGHKKTKGASWGDLCSQSQRDKPDKELGNREGCLAKPQPSPRESQPGRKTIHTWHSTGRGRQDQKLQGHVTDK